MAPRKSYWIFLVVGLAFLCLMTTAPVARAIVQHADPCPSQPGDAGIVDSPGGGPTGSGGSEGGDPDDYSNLLRAPDDPTLDSVSDSFGAQVDRMRQLVWTDPMFHALLLWLGLDR